MSANHSNGGATDPEPEERGRRRDSIDDHMDHLDDIEAQSPFDENATDRGIGALHHIRSRTRSRPGQLVIEWDYDDPEHPPNWSDLKKAWILFITGALVINSTVGSALPSMAVGAITKEFNVFTPEQRVLPISVYLIGYVFGPLVWGPLSEHFGRRLLIFVTFVLFCIFTLACGFAPNFPALLVFRLFCGVFGSCPIAVVAGILADVYVEPRSRGRAFSIFMVATVFGPLLAPIISGYCSSTIGWRWTFYIAVMFGGATGVLVAFLPETYSPILLSRRAARLRKESPGADIVAPRDLEQTNIRQLLTVVLTRPLRMIFTEPIVAATCAYMALVYAIFYMSFQAFPIVFQQLYHLSPGVTGLCYLPIGGGAIIALPIFWYWDNVLAKAVSQGKNWTKREEFRRLPLGVIGGPMFVIALFWLGFSAKSGVSFVAPMLAGIPFGLGFVLIFMALLNYLTDAYDIFAASANAAASTCRSLLAVVLPLATTHMFSSLGISGACALLGGLSAVMCVIPFIFIWKGPSIRERSRFCIALKERREAMQKKADEDRQRREQLPEKKIDSA